ncbi:hypothetical protein glysoja_049850 [Glycine soja]|uniref:Replication protein A 70 kDa DNA-binding subunit B/D first OB fold domain-containing protein n=1 Tax=Glycine soja TaxID=3848 RepID=A0A0B2PB57_GLYSO|nr:hypothetical protein glysoja_049850 [Glycine soja]
MSRKENLLCELHTKKGTWKIVVRYMWRLNKHNGQQSIEMVLMDHTCHLYLLRGTKIGATLWQKLFPEFEPKLRCGGAYVIQNVKVVDTHSNYNVSAIKYLVYFVKTTSVKEVDRPEIPPNVHAITSFADIISGVAKPDTLVDIVGVIAEVIERKTVNPAYRVTVKLRDNNHAGIIMIVWEEYALQLDDAIEKNHFVQKPLVVMLTLAKIKEPKDDEGGVSQSQSTQYCQDKFLHNAQIVSFGEIKTLRQSGDEIKVFPACVDQLLGKTWVVRFKHRIQMHQSSVLDFSEQEHHIQSVISTLGLQVIII